VFVVSGSITHQSVVELYAAIQDSIEKGGSRIVLDLKGTSYVDSSGIGLLVKTSNIAKESGGDLRLVSAPRVFLEVMRLSGLTDQVGTFASTDAAVESFANP